MFVASLVFVSLYKTTGLAFSGSYAGCHSDNTLSAVQSPDLTNAMAAPLINSGSQLQIHASKPTRSFNIAVPPGKLQEQNGARVPRTQQPLFSCGFCGEQSITKTCTRRNDLSRHIESFHNSNAVWFCHHSGCKMAFDWRAVYKDHLRNAHSRSQMNMADAVVRLCPQMVFACGFENCSHIFEAPGDDETAATFKKYSQHIVAHFGEGPNGRRWTYSARIHNLLRQSQVMPAWDKSQPKPETSRLRWEPQSSLILRKLLETKHLENLPSLIQFAIMLGSNPAMAKGFVSRLELPVKMKCAYDHAAFPNNRIELSTNADSEQASSTRGTSLDGRLSQVIIPRQYVPRSVEPFYSIQSAEYGQERYDDHGTLRHLTPKQSINMNDQVANVGGADLGCAAQLYSWVPYPPISSYPMEMESCTFVHNPATHLSFEYYNC